MSDWNGADVYIIGIIERQINWRLSTLLERLGVAQRVLHIFVILIALLIVSSTAWSQLLNENCVISILNRVTQVNPDGTWVIPNVPTNFGQVRARATCVKDGVTFSGQSDFFTIPPNGSVDVPDILIGMAVVPIPVSLTISAPTTTLPSVGATTQLAVVAVFSDDSTKEVTTDPSTSYITTNSAIATVSNTGLVTAVSSGTVIITVLQEAVSGFTQVKVVLSNVDSDGDGIPDDVELTNGLNPNNPVDGFEDLDGHGLTNKQELVDFGTNFRVADTDGDGANDGDEIEAATDPNNPGDSPGQELVSIEVKPSNFVITFNTILPEASRQLTVIGHLNNGNTVDLTSAPGTNYNSSDPTVCQIFADQPGEVFAGNDGTCTITVTNKGLSAQAFGTVNTFSPTALASVTMPGFANNVDVSGNFAYVAAGSAGLQVVDVSDRKSPKTVGSEDTPGNANDVKVVGNTAFVADGPAGLQIINITNPLSPAIIGSVDTPDDAWDVVVNGNLAYVADGSAGSRWLILVIQIRPVLSAL